MFSADRRSFLASVASLAHAVSGTRLMADPPSLPTNRRATDGDDVFEPDWEQRLTVTVGQKNGDLVGRSDRVLQAAVDYVSRFGGGTVQILPGIYTLRNSVFLPSNIRIRGSGEDSVITKIASESVALADDSDWYDQEITLEKGSGFRVGDGVALQAKNADHGGKTVIKRTLVARQGNRFKLNDGLREYLWLSTSATCSSLFPLLTSENNSNIVIEDITLDGNRKNNAHLDGNSGGCVFIQDCNRCTFKGVTARNNNGDGISFQICHDIVVKDCHCHDNADLGVHPGSGSQRPLIVNNRLERNNLGLFWCWGVKHGRAEGNRILNSGGDNGIGIDIQGKTKNISIVGNTLAETRSAMNRTGIRIASEVGSIQMQDNRIDGFAQQVDDQRVS